jgi:hypothetical protein
MLPGMCVIRFLILFLVVASSGCSKPQHVLYSPMGNTTRLSDNSIISDSLNKAGKEALISTRFTSFEKLKAVIDIQYFKNIPMKIRSRPVKNEVRLKHKSGDREVISILKSGISQTDFLNARKGNIWDKLLLGLKCPYAAINKGDLWIIENLGRRKPWWYGKGDVAFYDLAETMVAHIRPEDTKKMLPKDLTEKGFLNTFNHITAQAFMTSAFSEQTADFVADVHELYNMPELITGKFSEKQLTDLAEGPVDNYVDLINNEWGQELGKGLAKKYNISRYTYWTPELMASYLNDIKSYQSWCFQIGFYPYKVSDEVVVRFARKINDLKVSNKRKM